MNETGIASDLEPFKRPRARDWFWRPWYAKLWLLLAFNMLLISYLLPHDLLRNHNSVATIAMTVVLNPYLFFGILGYGYFRAAWKHRFDTVMPLDNHEWEWDDLRHRNDPSDPTDPNWYWHPMNPMSNAFRRGLHGEP